MMIQYFKPKYRIVTDKYSGYEVQVKRWWLPIWMQVWMSITMPINTFTTMEEAKQWIEEGCPNKDKQKEVWQSN